MKEKTGLVNEMGEAEAQGLSWLSYPALTCISEAKTAELLLQQYISSRMVGSGEFNLLEPEFCI